MWGVELALARSASVGSRWSAELLRLGGGAILIGMNVWDDNEVLNGWQGLIVGRSSRWQGAGCRVQRGLRE